MPFVFIYRLLLLEETMGDLWFGKL